MRHEFIKKANSLRGEIEPPGDKSISHRAVMFSAISQGKSRINNFLNCNDCNYTIDCFRKMGVHITDEWGDIIVEGRGLYGLKEPMETLYVGNSGTTMRLLSGILAGQEFKSILDGDESIRRRPMLRIADPLRLMGAEIFTEEGGHCPLVIKPSLLSGIEYTLPIPSAQVKSCILLAGLYAGGSTAVIEKIPSRDHTERMLHALGADIESKFNKITLYPGKTLNALDISVPGDISSAAYFIAAALIHPDAELLISNVNINPTRAGIIKVIMDMGGNIELLNEHLTCGEEVCDIHVKSSFLHSTEIRGEIIPTLIDELPIIAVMAAFAEGTTIIADAAELRRKESDRIEAVCENLKKMGAHVTPTEDGMIIRGGAKLHGADITTYKDHRIAMAFAIAGLVTGDVHLDDPDCVNVSFKDFYGLATSIAS